MRRRKSRLSSINRTRFFIESAVEVPLGVMCSLPRLCFEYLFERISVSEFYANYPLSVSMGFCIDFSISVSNEECTYLFCH